MESGERQLRRCLDALRQAGDERPVGDILWADLPSLLDNETIARQLIAQVATLDEAAVDADAAELRLLEALLDEARRAREDGRRTGQGFVEAARHGLEALDVEDVTDAGRLALGRAYYRAGVDVPPVLQSWEIARLAQEGPTAGESDPAALAEQLSASIAELYDSCDGQLSAVHQMLGESLAMVPDEACEALVHELARQDDGHGQHLALYWLLDPRPALARAAADALREAADHARLADGVAARLAWMRSLLPPGETLQAVDHALASQRKLQRGWSRPEDTGRTDQARVSLPDGAGAQYIGLGVQAAHGYTWSLVLIKAGQGIRDAYVLSELDAESEQAVWGSLADAAQVYSVGRTTVTALIGAALGETHARGERPPPGLIDVVATAGLTDLRPSAYATRDWLREIDPNERLAGLTPQKRGRLINRGSAHAERLGLVASWFEDRSEVTDLLDRTPSHNKRVQALREDLESRRQWWAELCLRSAHVLQDADPGEGADSLAATGLALLDGRELKRIPLITTIVETTIAAHDQFAAPRIYEGDPGSPAADLLGDESQPAIEALVDPGRARLQPLFDQAHSPTGQSIGGYFGLHGYLFAIVTHPDLLMPSQWLDPLIELLDAGGSGLADEDAANRTFADLFALYNEINERVMATQPVLPQGCTLRSRPVDNLGPAAPLGQWATGFTRARQYLGHAADRRMDGLDDDGEMAEGIAIATDLIEFLAIDPAMIDTADPANDSFEHVAELACGALGGNQKLLCAARMIVSDDLSEAPTAAGAEAEGDGGLWRPETILAHLDDPQVSYQWTAMDQAAAQASAITPLLLERIESVAADPHGWAEREAAAVLYPIALLGHFRETAAHEPLVRLAALPEDVEERLLGDAITELMPLLLWQTSGGETAGLKRVAEQREAYGFGRGAAIEALVFGVLLGELERSAILEYLVALLQDETFAPQGDPVWSCLLMAVVDLHPTEYEAVVRAHVAEADPTGALGVSLQELDRILSQDHDTTLERKRHLVERRFPQDVHGYLSHWHGFQPPGGEPEPNPFGPLPEGFTDGAEGPQQSNGKRATQARGPSEGKKKRKRKQQKQSRKSNRKRR